MSPMPGVTDTLAPLMFLAMTVTMVMLVFGAPVLIFVSIRFLWYRHIYIGRSKELEKLIWQLHRIASALEHRLEILPPDGKPTAAPEPRGILMSMFGR
jgi:hypothetical protein